MAGIGFVLRELARKDDLIGPARGYVYSAFVTAGPWLVTVLTIALLSILGEPVAGRQALEEFRRIVIYNFAFSLVFSSPLAMVLTRALADRLFACNAGDVRALAGRALALGLGVQLPFVAGFYFFVAKLTPELSVGAVAHYSLVSGLWLASVFLTALKDYKSIAWSFVAGLAVAMGLGLLGLHFVPSLPAPFILLSAMTIGLALVLAAILGRIFAEYPGSDPASDSVRGLLTKFKTLALGGLFYNAGIWADKWVMWGAPERDWPASNLITYPAYDGALFLAHITLVPAMALMVVHLETEFFAHYRYFFRRIARHATLDKIQAAQTAIQHAVWRSARTLLVVQFGLAVIVVLLAPGLTQLIGLHASQLGMFRMGVLGTACHAVLLFFLIILSYFDLRRAVMLLGLFFLGLNIGLSFLSREAGFAFYGYGYLMAAALSAFAAAGVTLRALDRLPYLTFIATNDAIRRDREGAGAAV